MKSSEVNVEYQYIHYVWPTCALTTWEFIVCVLPVWWITNSKNRCLSLFHGLCIVQRGLSVWRYILMLVYLNHTVSTSCGTDICDQILEGIVSCSPIFNHCFEQQCPGNHVYSWHSFEQVKRKEKKVLSFSTLVDFIFAAVEQCGIWKKVTEEHDKCHHAACCVPQQSESNEVLLSLSTCTFHYSLWCVYMSVSCIHWCEWCINKCTVKGKDLQHTESDLFFNTPHERQFELFEHYNI